MPKNAETFTRVDCEEYEEANDNVTENLETTVEECHMRAGSPLSSQNPVGYNPPKNGLIASALEIPNSVCFSFEQVDPQLRTTPLLYSTEKTAVQDEKHSGLCIKLQKNLPTSQGLEFTKSDNQGQFSNPTSVLSSSKQYKEVLIDGFAILSFKTMGDMLEFTKLSESQNPGLAPISEQTYKRARRCGMPKRKRTKAFLKQTPSQTSASNDLLNHRRHYHHHHHHHHNHLYHNSHLPSKKSQPSEHQHSYVYKSHYETNRLSSLIHLSPNNESFDTKSKINKTITNINNNIHHSCEVNNISHHVEENTNHDVLRYRDESPQYSPYCFTSNLSINNTITNSIPSTTTTIIDSTNSNDRTFTPPNYSHHQNHHQHPLNHNNHSTLMTMPKIEHIYSKKNIQSPEYSSVSPLNHSNLLSSSPSQDCRLMSGMWNSLPNKPDTISLQKTDKITYGKNFESNNVKPCPKVAVCEPSKRSVDSVSSSKSHCHQFSVAALTDEVMHPSHADECYKPQTVISKSPKYSGTSKKRTYRKSEQRDSTNLHEKHLHNHNECDKQYMHSKSEYSAHTNRCSIVDNSRNNKSSNPTVIDSVKGATSFLTTVSTNHHPDQLHDSISRYSSFMANHHLNSLPSSLHNSFDSLPYHPCHLPPRALGESKSCGSQVSQFKPASSSKSLSNLAPPLFVPSNPFSSHQNLLKQFMGIDSETANQLFSDPRFMEIYALTIASLSNNNDASTSDPRISFSNHENTIIPTLVNNSGNQNNATYQDRNGGSVGQSRVDPSLNTNISSPHCGLNGGNSSGIQNKLHPSSNMLFSGSRFPLASGAGSSPHIITSNSSTNRFILSNPESLSVNGSSQMIGRSQAVLAAAYADRELVSSSLSNPTLTRVKSSSQGSMMSNSISAASSPLNNSPPLPATISNINYCLPNNRNVQNFNNILPNSIIQRHHLTSLSQSMGLLESLTSTAYNNSKSNPIGLTPSQPDVIINKNLGSYPLKLFNGDVHNPVSSSSSMSNHDNHNMELYKPEYLLSELFHRPNLPRSLPLIQQPSSYTAPSEFLRPCFIPDTQSFPGSKINFTLNSSFTPSSPQLQSVAQPMYFPMRGSHALNRSDKTNYSGILHLPVHGDKLYGRWADAHIRIALFIQHCKSTQRSQSPVVSSSMFSASRLPIRPGVKRLNQGIHSSIPSVSIGPVNYNSSRINTESMNVNNRSAHLPQPLPLPPHHPATNYSVNSNNNGPPFPGNTTSDLSFWGHLFNEFLNNLSKEFLNSTPDCKDAQLAILQNFYSQMSQINPSLLGSLPKSLDFPSLISTVSSSRLPNSLSMPSGSSVNISSLNFPLTNQSNFLPAFSSSSCVRPTVLPSSPTPMNVPLSSLSTNLLNNNDLKRRRTDSSSMEVNFNHLPSFPLRFPNLPRPPNFVPRVTASHQHQQHSLPHAPPPAHSDMTSVAANLLNGFRLPESFLNLSHPVPPPPVPNDFTTYPFSSSTSLNASFLSNDKNVRSLNTITTTTNTSNSSNLVSINPW
ncbi:hypothetical protein EWB00_004985 [Schistosoma japonicum]|uniref:Uncharacterized protein n=1 Tax=Schistosoma japonicum TaxID=6182 RepID=A0A4Z2D3B5_SCHJA|nr:hypothetical protein KSF78_0005951 [Schistosoma japonicum]TNN10994.1 hypothetical protein EWB00_004985 [Schistosoma japonicum]